MAPTLQAVDRCPCCRKEPERNMKHRHPCGQPMLLPWSLVALIASLIFLAGCATTSGSKEAPTETVNAQPITATDQQGHASAAQEAFDGIDDPFDDPFEDPFADDARSDTDDPNAIYRDPWEPANTKTFAFNLNLDKFFLKPIATAYDWFMPDAAQHGIKNAFTNLAMPRRFFNSIFQGKFDGAGREFARFTINTTAGIGGLFDVASHPFFGIEPSNEDTGQTFAVWGADSGPYVVLPLLGPSSVRDGIGLIFDAALEPLTYISFLVLTTTAGYGAYGGEVTNDRSLHLEAFDNIETTSIDFYTSVQDAYFQFRNAAIKD
ncbi:MAG TPA: VacJ family lipoprotein [Nitrospirales bacterium]|nr:VacJ family lipoprotein [Nitrospirales bacterium]HIN32473.1 VacJ family lipoprotein [Nitrospirales bacterium]